MLGDAFKDLCCWTESLLSIPSALGLLPCLPPGATVKYLLLPSGPAQASLPSCTFFGMLLHTQIRLDRPNLSSAANWS